MAETVRKSKLMFLKLIAKLFASVLSLLGVLSSCEYNEAMAAYGVEGVRFVGKTLSSKDSSGIAGIQVILSSADSTEEFAETISDSWYCYDLSVHPFEITLPDSVRLTATDIDGAENGSFAKKDTLLYLDESEDYATYYNDLYLQENDE